LNMNQKTILGSLGLLIAFFVASVVPCRASSVTWTNASGGNWSNPTNWSPNEVPGPADTAVITTDGTYSVSLDVSPTVAGLDLGASSAGSAQSLITAGQTLTVNGPIRVTAQGLFNLASGGLEGTNVLTGTLTWSGGSISGNMTVATNSIFDIVTGGGNEFVGLVLTNYGTVNWTNTTIYSHGPDNAQIYNYGLWNAQSDNTFQGAYGGGSTLFDNFGTFLKSGGTNTTTLDSGVVFNNTGTVNVASGTLDIGGGSSSGGDFTTAAGAALNFVATVYDFTNNNTFTGIGSFVTGGATFGGTMVGTLSWSGGNLTGVLTVATNSFFDIVTGGGNELDDLVLTNYGTVNWTNTTIYSHGPNNAQIYNYGVWDAQSDNEFQGGYGGGTTLFDNFGTFIKSGNSGTTTLDSGVVFNNTGTVHGDSGTLDIQGGGVNSGSGTFATANGGLLVLDGITFSDGVTISSSTVVDLGGNTTVIGVLTATNLQLVSGTLSGTNVLMGMLTWSGGSISGVLTIASNSVLNIVAGGGNELDGLVLTNYGTVNWTNTTIYSHGPDNAQIYNYGLWNAQSDNDFQGGFGGGTTLFDNFGTFLKSGSTNTTTLDSDIVFNNTGTIHVESGTLDIDGGGTSSNADLTTSGSGTINFFSYVFADTNTFTGLGSFVAGGATFDGTIVGTLNWDGGNLAGVLTIPTNSLLNIVAGGGNAFYGLVLTNYGTVKWTNTTIYSQGPNNAQIYNYGLWNAQSDNEFQGGYGGGSTLFDNFGMFLKSASTNTSTLDSGVVFNNTGAVNVASGMLQIGGGISSGGEFTTASGAILNFIDTAYDFTNNNTFTGIGSFVTGGATFDGTIAGTLSWSGGSLAGVLTVPTNGSFNIVTGGGNELNGLVLTNYGTVNWTNATIYSHGPNNAQIYNYGLWNAQGDDTFQGGYGGGTTLFDNFGTFLKSGNSGATILDNGVVFNNTGTVNGNSGTLEIQGGGVNSGSGTFNTANGGFLVLDGIDFANSTAIASSTVVDLGGNTTVNGVLTATNLQLVSGTLGGTNVLMATLTWSGGNISGVLTIASNSVLNIVAGGGNEFDGLVLTNYGTVNWTNTSIYSHGPDNAQIYNYGLWNAQSDDTFQGGFGGGTTLFDNFGTFLKSGSTNTTTLDSDIVFNNTGAINVESGTLDINGGGTSSNADLTTSGAGIINFFSYVFDDTNTFTGLGSFVAGGATFGGTIVGTLNWDGGNLAGVLTIPTNSFLNIVAGGGNAFYGLVLTNYGTVNWTNATIYSHGPNNAQIYNYGLWNAQSDNTFQGGYGGGSTLFDNFGMFLKSGSTNTTTLDSGVVFNNTGAVNVASGALDIGGGTSSGGEFTTASGMILNFIDTAYDFTNSTTFNGSGSFVTSGATFDGTILGTLTWDGGSLSGVLTLATNSVLNIVAGGGNELIGLVLTNFGTINWTNTTLYSHGPNNAQIYNYGLWNAQSDNAFQGGYGGGTTLFDNFGTFLKSGNTGATTLDGGVVFTNNGILDAQVGNISLEGAYNLANGTLDFGISGLTNYATISLAGAAVLSGTVSANLINGFQPVNGDSFTNLYYGSFTGTFANTVLPAGYLWSTNYTPTNFYLQIGGTGPQPPLLGSPRLSSNTLQFTFLTANGQSYTVQTNSNLETTNWVFFTNFTGNGSLFQFVTPVTKIPELFFRVRQP
jgi:hypothetical protein